MQQIYTTEKTITTLKPALKLVFIGFEDNPTAYLIRLSGGKTRPEIIQSLHRDPFDHLDILNRQQQLPDALIIDLRWLIDQNFTLLQQLRLQAELRALPVIVLGGRESAFPKAELARLGVDDCYRVPVEWRTLEQRIEFVKKNKPMMLQYQRSTPQVERVQPIVVDPFKRAFDVLGALFGLAIFSPVFILVAIAIRIESKGPIFYRSKRVGRGFDTFDFWKFRSMYADADRRLAEMREHNQYGQNGVFVKFSNDPRITKVGRFIRKYSIDELPQLFNVLLGDMSLVGNRPLPIYEAEALTIGDRSTRFLAPAGLTGLWQVTKRGSNDMSVEERIALDVRYAREHSFWYDFDILLRTFTAFVQKENV